MELSKVFLSRLLNVVWFILVILINAMAAFLPLNAGSVGQSSPPGVLNLDPRAFVVWGVIYVLMGLFIIYQLLPFTYGYAYINQGITPYFWLQALANVGWLFAQTYGAPELYWLKLILIYILFLSVLLIYVSVYRIIRRSQAPGAGGTPDPHYYLNYFIGRLWISVYFAWIISAVCVGSFGSLADTSVNSIVNGAIVFGAVGLLALFILFANFDVPFGLTVVWTSIWLAYTSSYALLGGNNDEQLPIFISAVVVGGMVFVGSLVALTWNMLYALRRATQRPPKSPRPPAEPATTTTPTPVVQELAETQA